MTPREHLSRLAGEHASELETMHRGSAILVVVWLSYMALTSGEGEWLPASVGHALRLGLALLALCYYLYWRRKNAWFKKFRCPSCGVDLSYWLTDSDYYREARGKGVSDAIDRCPYCSLALDDDMNGSRTEHDASQDGESAEAPSPPVS